MAIQLNHGGTYDNKGTITGTGYGIEIYGGTGTVVNSGSIKAFNYYGVAVGVLLKNGGSVTNSAGGYISAKSRGFGYGYSYGIELTDGGSVTNAAGATINGYEAIRVSGAAGKVTNSGSIKSSVSLLDGGVVTNSGAITSEVSISGGSAASMVTNNKNGTVNSIYLSDTAGNSALNAGTVGSISISGSGANSVSNAGTVGSISLSGSGSGSNTVTNSGKITGVVSFSGTGANTLTLQTGSVITGLVKGSTAKGATNALVLTGSGSINSSFQNFNRLSVKATGTWTLGVSFTGDFGATVVSTGTLALALSWTATLAEAAGTTIIIGSGDTLTLTGASSLSGTISGLGTFALAGATTFGSGAKLTVSDWSIQGSGSATIGAALSYAGGFYAGYGAVITLSGGSLLLSGATTFSGATLAGSKALTVSGTTNVLGLTIADTNGLTDAGLLTQTGVVNLGDAKGDVSLITVEKAGRWDIVGDFGINLGSSGALSIHNFGLFEKTSGNLVSAISPAVVNSGEALVTSGTLDFQAAVTGTGTDVIASVTAILEFDSTVAKTQTIDFVRPDGVLFLGSPTGFAGVLDGIDTIFTNDAVELLGSWSIKGYAQTNATEGTLTLSDGTHSAAIAFDGSYSKTRFHASAFGGQTTVTYI